MLAGDQSAPSNRVHSPTRCWTHWGKTIISSSSTSNSARNLRRPMGRPRSCRGLRRSHSPRCRQRRGQRRPFSAVPRESGCPLSHRRRPVRRPHRPKSSGLQDEVTSRIKVMGNLDIAETRLPQDGRFSLPIGNQTANSRCRRIPRLRREGRDPHPRDSGKQSMITLEKMMMSQSILQPFRRLIQNPNGIIFVTGPTGSGQDHDALLRAPRDQLARAQHLDDRGPDRDPRRGHPEPGQRDDRPQVRQCCGSCVRTPTSS